MATWGARWGAAMVLLVFVFVGVPLAACGDSGGSTPTDTLSATDTLTSDTLTNDTAADDTLTNDTAGVDATGAGVTFDAPHAVFAAKCSPCHTGGGSGGHNMGAADLNAAYVDSQKAAAIAKCSGLTKGACTIVRIKAGDMPQGRGCTGDPTQDAANGDCLTQAQQDTIQQWIDDGQLAPAN